MQRLKDNQTQDELLKLKKAVEASGEVVFITDREGVITYINPEFTKLYGYNSEEITGKTTPRILKSGIMGQEAYQRFWEALLSGQVVKGEFINQCKDGSMVTVEGSANPILDEKDKIIGFLAIQRDITKRKRAKEALEAAHAFQQSIIDGVADPIMVIDTQFKVVVANRAAREFVAEDVDTSLPMYCYELSHHRKSPCIGNEHPCPLEEVRELGQSVTVVHEHFQANGERRFVEVVAAPMWQAEGEFHGIIESMRDITERKRAEEAVLNYAELLKTLAAQLADVEEVERQRIAQELHDKVGQNLTALGINLNIIRMQLPEDVPSSIHYHIGDSLSLVEQTTERIRDVMADLRPPVLDDYGLVAALRWYAEKVSRRTSIPVAVEGEEPDPRLDARVENSLFRIAQEALTNVAKHAQASHVTISVESESDFLRLTIADDGVGFDTHDFAEPDEGRGWGLLSISERAESAGGRCQVVSSPHQGTQVSVEVPR